MKSYLICYDIDDDRERNRVAKLLERHGQRVQYSVFELHLRSERKLRELQQGLRDILGDDSDEVRFYRLTANGVAASHSLSGAPIARRDLVVII
jgi:CRISPR-associated protein Cas2